MAEDQLEQASKALESVNKSMLSVTQAINDMKQLEIKSSGKVQQ
jgi:hypothetical protein